jgi:hypothetical protein
MGVCNDERVIEHIHKLDSLKKEFLMTSFITFYEKNFKKNQLVNFS